MDQIQELRDEVGRVGRLIDAGQRGVPIGGELLIAFGLVLGVLGSLGAATAFGILPLQLMLSPLAAAAAFLSFVLLSDGARRPLPKMLLVVAVATVAGELVSRGAMAGLEAGGSAARGFVVAGLIGVPLLMIAFGALVGLRRLRVSAAAAAPANRAMLGIWAGLAVAMAVTIALCGAVGLRTGYWFGLMLLPGLFWILWGAGWWASGAMTQSRWMYGVAAGSWAVAVWYAATSWFYSTSIVGLLALAVLPGVQLLREARATHEA